MLRIFSPPLPTFTLGPEKGFASEFHLAMLLSAAHCHSGLEPLPKCHFPCHFMRHRGAFLKGVGWEPSCYLMETLCSLIFIEGECGASLHI